MHGTVSRSRVGTGSSGKKRATGRRRPTSHPFFAVLAVATTALVLRPAASAVGPLLEEISSDLDMSPTTAGFLTALPGLCFGLVGLTASRLAPRLGLVSALMQACLLITLGSLVRVLTDSWELFLGFSFVALAGMAIGNVLLPAFIKLAFPGRSTGMATMYTTMLAVGTIAPTLLARPLEDVGARWFGASGGWRLGLGVWAVLGLVVVVLWLGVRAGSNLPRNSSSFGGGDRVRSRDLWRSRTAVALMLYFGLQSMQAYVQFGWLPQAFRDGGLAPGSAALMLSLVAFGGIPGGLLMPRVVAGQRLLRPAVIFFAVLMAVGYLGVAYLPTTLPWLWAVCLGISGFAFATALALIIERTDSPEVTAAVSGFVQPYGYFLAALGPFLVGLALELVGDWKPILLVLAASGVLVIWSGLVATRPTVIDQELRGGKETRRLAESPGRTEQPTGDQSGAE